MTRQKLGCSLIGALALLFAVSLAVFYISPPAKLNVVLVTLDTTRADHVGCYGYQSARTPALDALAEKGVLFENAYAPAPITLPSHASMFTGLYPPEHGLLVNGKGRLESRLPVLAEALQNVNYRTGAFIGSFVLDSKFGLNRGFQTYDDNLTDAAATRHSLHRKRSGATVMDSALAWLRQRDSRPFFCWIHLYDAHAPYEPREATFGDAFARQPYDAGVAFADLQLQRLREFLQTQGIDNRTLIVVAGDHGEGLMEHSEQEHGFLLYDSALRVPLIIAGSSIGMPRGHRVSAPVSLVDVMPTILNCLNIPQPGPVSGRSIKPSSRGAVLGPHPCFATTDTPFLEDRWAPLRAVVSERWKYIETTRSELYDLSRDPAEVDNLAERQPEKRRELEAVLREMERRMVVRAATDVNLTAAERRILESLGYAGGGKAPAPPAASEHLPDVKDMMPHYNKLVEAKILIEKNKLADGIALVREVLATAPKYSSARILLGDALLQLKDYSEAMEIFQHLIADQPDRSEPYAHLASVFVRQGLYSAAVHEYQKALAIEPEDATCHANLAFALQGIGRREEALVELEEAVKYDAHDADARIQLANLLFQMQRNRHAIEHYVAALQLRPDLAIVHWNLARALAADKRGAEAIPYIADAARLDPENVEIRVDFAKMLSGLRRHDEAVIQLTDAARLRPDDKSVAAQLERARSSAMMNRP